MSKVVGIEEAIESIESGMTVMLGGFFWSGSPFSLVRALTARKGKLKDLTLISNDAASASGHTESYGNALIATGMFRKCVASFIGHNHEAMRRIARNELELEMVPMGTFAERIRIGGAGIGGFLTKTGVGTIVADGKETMIVDGVEYLLEKPLNADVALLYGSVADENGNVRSFGTARNFNTVMAAAANYSIVETRKLVNPGELDASDIAIPAPYIDAIVYADEKDYTLKW
jgi:acetate CoA/acetoacetate CoA-transferase alpha subunit